MTTETKKVRRKRKVPKSAEKGNQEEVVNQKKEVQKKEPKKQTVSNHNLIKSVELGESFSGVYYVHAVSERIARNGNPFTDLQLGDRSGNSFVRHWGKVEDSIKKGTWVAIQARTDEYNGQMQIIADRVEPAEEPSELNDYVPISETLDTDKNRFEKYINRVLELCDEIDDATCVHILGYVFSKDFKDEFFEAPYNDQPSYGMLGGALSHTVKCVHAVGGFAQNYNLSTYETVIAVTVSLLHGCGSKDAFSFDGALSEQTASGKLYGLKELSLECVRSALQEARKLAGFNEETAMRVIHALSTFDQAGPVMPMTKEAILISEVIDTDLKLTQATDFIEVDTNQDSFTAYDPSNKRQYYKGHQKK